METSEVVLEGTVLPGFAAQEVAATLAAMAKLNQDQALALLTSGKPRLARKGLSPETAQALAERFAAMGVAAFVRTAGGEVVQPSAPPQSKPSTPQQTNFAPPVSAPEGVVPSAPKSAPQANQSASPSPSAVSLGKGRTQPEAPSFSPDLSPDKDRIQAEAGEGRTLEERKKFCRECGAAISPRAEVCPRCGVRQLDWQDEEDRDFNPYTAPQSDVSLTRPQKGSYWRETCVVVPAARGLQWIKESWTMLKSAPGTWIGALLLAWACLGMMAALSFGLILVAGPLGPIIGGLALFLCGPFFAGGLALLAHRQTEQEAFSASDVFAAFQTCPDRILLLCVLEFAYSSAVDIIIGLASALTVLLPILFVVVIPLGLFLFLSLFTASCMAPTLVAVAGQSPVQSLWQGFLSTCKNWRPVLLNGLIMGGIPAGLSVLFLLLMSIVATGADARSGDGFEALGMLVLVAGPLIFLACLPMFALGPAIIYRAVRDIFYEAGEEGASGATHVS